MIIFFCFGLGFFFYSREPDLAPPTYFLFLCLIASFAISLTVDTLSMTADGD